jgi:hypothetical protein
MTSLRLLLCLLGLALWSGTALADEDEAAEAAAAPAEDDTDDGISDNPDDADGDGIVEPDEAADNAEFKAEFAGISDEPDEAALDKRSEDAELVPSLTPEQFRKMVGVARKVVLAKMEKKIAKKSDERMATFGWIVSAVSLCGIFLLAMPLVLRRKYPGQGAMLLKYSGLAALVFFVTVNLFGGVLYGMRSVQGALSGYTNPSIAIAKGTFDTLDDNADKYVTIGKELFAPTLEQMRANPDEQPAALILENGQKLLKDATVFLKIKKMIKSADFLFGILPIILTLVTLVLFVLAIRPTLTEIINLPARAAQGHQSAAREVVRNSLRRVKGELLATLCTLGVLTGITVVSSLVLGRIVVPAIDMLLEYFSAAVSYLQFVDGASSTLVFLALFGVILFLVFNLATLILSSAFFLGKCQKIFQRRFNDGLPVRRHRKFFKWGVPAVLLVQLFPVLFVYVATFGLGKINDAILSGVTDAEAVSWGKLMLAGPLFLVVGYIALFWTVRGIKAIKFLATYKVPVPEQNIVTTPFTRQAA